MAIFAPAAVGFFGTLAALSAAAGVQGSLFSQRLKQGLKEGTVLRYTPALFINEDEVVLAFCVSSRTPPLFSLVIPEAMLPVGLLEPVICAAGEIMRRHMGLGWSDDRITHAYGMELSKAADEEPVVEEEPTADETPAEAEAPAKDWKPFGEDGPSVMDIKGTPHGSGPAMA